MNSNQDRVVLAPDEFNRLLLEAGWEVDVVTVGKSTGFPLFRSGLRLKQLLEVQLDAYDLVWHMFRDPTSPEIVELLTNRKLNFGKATLVNDGLHLRNHNKHHYLPVLERLGIGTEPIGTDLSVAEWIKDTDIWISKDRTLIATHGYNSNRGVYPEWGHGRVVTRFIDNAQDGFRSFVRFGYAFGECCPGLRYYLPESIPAARTGGAKKFSPYVVPESAHAKIRAGMEELGCDVCHIEAIPVDDGLRICDVNPNPTANGRTLTPITEALVRVIDRYMRERLA